MRRSFFRLLLYGFIQLVVANSFRTSSVVPAPLVIFVVSLVLMMVRLQSHLLKGHKNICVLYELFKSSLSVAEHKLWVSKFGKMASLLLWKIDKFPLNMTNLKQSFGLSHQYENTVPWKLQAHFALNQVFFDHYIFSPGSSI